MKTTPKTQQTTCLCGCNKKNKSSRPPFFIPGIRLVSDGTTGKYIFGCYDGIRYIQTTAASGGVIDGSNDQYNHGWMQIKGPCKDTDIKI